MFMFIKAFLCLRRDTTLVTIKLSFISLFIIKTNVPHVCVLLKCFFFWTLQVTKLTLNHLSSFFRVQNLFKDYHIYLFICIAFHLFDGDIIYKIFNPKASGGGPNGPNFKF